MLADELTKADREFGEAGERKAYDILKVFDTTLKLHSERYDTIDFVGDNADVELKTRTCRYGAFPDIMINCCKSKTYNGSKKLYFAFQFTNGIWYIEYTPAAFADIEQRMFKRNGSIYAAQLCFFIPLNRLTKLQ